MLIWFVAFSQSPVPKVAALSKVDTLSVVLDSFPVVPADCGICYYAYGFKFSIINTNFPIVAIVGCPEGYGKFFFVKGDKYVIRAVKIDEDNNQYSSGILKNPYNNRGLLTYSVLSIRRLK